MVILINIRMSNIIVPKWPVVIFASPRTGSTALGYHIANNTSAKYYNEPNFRPAELEEFIEFSKSNNNYILKLLGSSIPMFPQSVHDIIFSDNVFKIKMNRRNIINQIASHYIGINRQTWNYLNNENYNNLMNSDIIIELGKVRRSIEMVRYDRNIVDKIKTDIELFYEDFVNFDSPMKKTPLPSNYAVLIEAISNLYSSRVS
jgi:hypothetical protein